MSHERNADSVDIELPVIEVSHHESRAKKALAVTLRRQKSAGSVFGHASARASVHVRGRAENGLRAPGTAESRALEVKVSPRTHRSTHGKETSSGPETGARTVPSTRRAINTPNLTK